MTEEPDNLIVRHLPRVDEKMDRLVDDIHGIKVRLTAVGEGLVGIQRRIDRMDNRLDRIERRLDLSSTDSPDGDRNPCLVRTKRQTPAC